MRQLTYRLCAVALIGTVAPFPAAAQTPSPIHVITCDPVAPQTTVNYRGYSPAFYPTNPYYWNDPYGFRYRQYPVATTTHTTSGMLNIHYVNKSPAPIKQIDFGLVAKGHLVAEVRDVGTFSQGAEIKHSFGLGPNVFPIGTNLAKCVPLRVAYEDGTKWKNPHLPRLDASIYR